MHVGDAVFDPQAMHRQAGKYVPDVGGGVDADHHYTTAIAHDGGHRLMLVEPEWDAVAFHLPVGRVETEEGVGAVIALDAILPIQIFHRCFWQPYRVAHEQI